MILVRLTRFPPRRWMQCGPVAQLGARFHGMEEVDGSNPSRSTKTSHRPVPPSLKNLGDWKIHQLETGASLQPQQRLSSPRCSLHFAGRRSTAHRHLAEALRSCSKVQLARWRAWPRRRTACWSRPMTSGGAGRSKLSTKARKNYRY